MQSVEKVLEVAKKGQEAYRIVQQIIETLEKERNHNNLREGSIDAEFRIITD